MTLLLNLPPDLEHQLRQKVGPKGDVEKYVVEMLQRDLAPPASDEDVMREFGMTREELRADLEKAWQEGQDPENWIDGRQVMAELRERLERSMRSNA